MPLGYFFIANWKKIALALLADVKGPIHPKWGECGKQTGFHEKSYSTFRFPIFHRRSQCTKNQPSFARPWSSRLP